MGRLIYVSLNSEHAYIDKFCEEYKDKIKTPDCFTIVCKYLERTARHVCGGRNYKFQEDRANRILWPKSIFLNPEKRKVLLDQKTKKLIFFLEKGRTNYAVICSRFKNENLNFISGFIVGGNRAKAYKEDRNKYPYYKRQGC